MVGRQEMKCMMSSLAGHEIHEFALGKDGAANERWLMCAQKSCPMRGSSFPHVWLMGDKGLSYQMLECKINHL